ncbi:hypothetical protein, variant [Fonticula alba]|uniref:Uncharacterized protein n=1 Tax=Fonticula alba TaxID=691883 RepID=A0A058Z062_FONAL|nr:hypothetical protein, variant [Fonticula alba]KCV67659.1 hypothetical protein, variant [Fonticula alba]|eukprot:XP_009497997.1 hypothetical protein, variant [Fonticula alba]
MATSVYMHVGPSEQAARAAGRPVPQPGRQTRPRPPVAEHTPYGPAGPHAGHPLAVYGAAEGPAPGARPPAPALAEHAEGDDESSRYLVISYVRNLAPGAPPLRLDIYLLACERASWHPGRIPFANYSAYTAYFREVLPTPRRMNIFHSSRAVGAMTIAGISLCVLIAGAATPPRNVVLLAVGLSGLGLSAVVLLVREMDGRAAGSLCARRGAGGAAAVQPLCPCPVGPHVRRSH